MPYLKHDVGENNRNWDKGDCTVRALSTVSGLSYQSAWELLYKVQGEHRTCSFRLPDFLRRDPEKFGKVRAIIFRTPKGSKRITGEQFCALYPRGKYILRMAHHVTAVVDGVLIDKWNSSRKCVYTAWEFQS